MPEPPVAQTHSPHQPAPRVLPLDSGARLSGTEIELLIYDAWSGLDPDSFGAATGALRGGGLLLLLTPPLEDWPNQPDPQAGRIAVWPHKPETLSRRFQRRFVQVLLTEAGVTSVRERPATLLPPASAASDLPVTQGSRFRTPDPREPATPDQGMAIEAVLDLARGRPRRPLVLTAHRGRGKSAALGIASGRLAREGCRRILVTAPRFAACDTLFRHFGLTYGTPADPPASAEGRPDPLRFLPPDELLQNQPPADLLLVDEAAGIPAPLLASLLGHYPRVCFATTVHGYEGTGRGFDLRFRGTLDRETPGWHQMTLRTPIRWAPEDPLEALVFRALLLDASPALQIPSPEATEAPELVRLDRDTLAVDEPTLRQVFGLLVLAHYQTRPLDLRMLLDGPNIRVYALRQGGQVLGTLLAAEEGALESEDLRQGIFRGQRRPRGHLLPQTLSAHGALMEAPALRYLRVVRIAVHPALLRRGIGARLLRRLALDGRREGMDLLGASFGATPGLLAFWGACGYRPVQIGTSRNAASGEHALVVLRPLSTAGWGLTRRAGRRLGQRLGVLLAGPLRRLDPRVPAALLQALGTGGGQVRPSASGGDPDQEEVRLEIDSFARGHRSLESALPPLAELTRTRLGAALRSGALDLPEAALLVAASLQLRPPQELVRLAGARGREALTQRIRDLVGRLADLDLPTVAGRPRLTGSDARPASAGRRTPGAGSDPPRSWR